jgi:hypothetical protein
MSSKIKGFHKVKEGIELICEEEKGISRRTYTYFVTINEEDFKRIKKEFEK